MDEIKPTDVVVDEEVVRPVQKAIQETGYPDNLTEEQIVRLIYFFGSRKLEKKFKKKGTDKVEGLSKIDRMFVEEAFKWFGLTYETPLQFAAAYRMLTLKFKFLLTFLKKRPAYLTQSIYQALKVAGYNNVVNAVVMVVDKFGNVVPRIASDNKNQNVIPLGKADTLLWNIQNITLDKMLMILQNITIKDIKKANLGIKSKALRDLFAMYHMSKLNTKTPNLTLINLSVNTAEPTQKFKAYSEYISRNREEK